MSTVFSIKCISAVVLLLAFFMPLSQCSGPIEENSDKPPEIIVKYAYSVDTMSPLALVANIGAFFWPILMVVLLTFKRALSSSLLIKFIELLFCFGTGYMLVVLNIFGKPLYGSYVAALAISIYGILTLYEIYIIFRVRKHNKPLNQIGAKNTPPG